MMHFDDRLGTVLRLRADGPAVRRIQYRQLLDLLGTLPGEARGDQVDCAFSRLADLAATIPPADRASMIRDQGLRLRSTRLVASLAAEDSQVAAAALERADLGEDEWLDLLPALPIGARGHVRRRRDLSLAVEAQLRRLGIHDRGLPPARVAAEADLTPSAANDAGEPVVVPLTTKPDVAARGDAPGDGIGAIVRKIEAYRKARQVVEHVPSPDAPRLPLDEDHVLHAPRQVQAFDFATDAAGRVVWADPGSAPMMVGQSLGALQDQPRGSLRAALRARQPLRALRLTLAGAPAIAGQWQADAAPWFDPLTGRHLGWRGRMRRPAEEVGAAIRPPAPKPDSQSDRIRQMLHELRTPVNAIQGFAEVIQQQLFGPTPHEYRALAATIAGDAARMLAAFEELERLAKLDSGALELEPGTTDLVQVVESTVGQLAAHTRQRGSGFALKIAERPLPVPLAQIEVERIVWRLLATLAGVSGPSEVLRLKMQPRGPMVRLDVALPATLAARSEKDLFATSAGSVPQVIAAGVFGVGFALRLIAAEAKAAGGQLVHKGDRLRIVLPGLTEAADPHSDVDAAAPDAQVPPTA